MLSRSEWNGTTALVSERLVKNSKIDALKAPWVEVKIENEATKVSSPHERFNAMRKDRSFSNSDRKILDEIAEHVFELYNKTQWRDVLAALQSYHQDLLRNSNRLLLSKLTILLQQIIADNYTETFPKYQDVNPEYFHYYVSSISLGVLSADKALLLCSDALRVLNAYSGKEKIKHDALAVELRKLCEELGQALNAEQKDTNAVWDGVMSRLNQVRHDLIEMESDDLLIEVTAVMDHALRIDRSDRERAAQTRDELDYNDPIDRALGVYRKIEKEKTESAKNSAALRQI